MENLLSAGKLTGGFFIAVATVLIGEVNDFMVSLIILMSIDYLLGVTSALVGKSNKTKDGRLSSHAGFIGIVKKATMMIIIIVAYQLERVTGIHEILTLTISAFIANECLSIVETAINMGVPVPRIVRKAISALEEKEDNDDSGEEGKLP